MLCHTELGLHIIYQGFESDIQTFRAILSRLLTDIWKLYGILRFKIYYVLQDKVQIFLPLAVPESFRHHIRKAKSEVRSLCTLYANRVVKSNMKIFFCRVLRFSSGSLYPAQPLHVTRISDTTDWKSSADEFPAIPVSRSRTKKFLITLWGI